MATPCPSASPHRLAATLHERLLSSVSSPVDFSSAEDLPHVVYTHSILRWRHNPTGAQKDLKQRERVAASLASARLSDASQESRWKAACLGRRSAAVFLRATIATHTPRTFRSTHSHSTGRNFLLAVHSNLITLYVHVVPAVEGGRRDAFKTQISFPRRAPPPASRSAGLGGS